MSSVEEGRVSFSAGAASNTSLKFVRSLGVIHLVREQNFPKN